MRKSDKCRIILFVFILPFIFALLGKAMPPNAPIKVSLSASGNPEIGVPLEITFSVSPLIDAPQIRIIIKVPDGVDVLEGVTDLSLSMNKGETKAFVVTVRFSQQGKYQFVAGASIEIDAETRLGANTDLLIDLGGTQLRTQQASKPKRRFKTKEGEAVME